jgi:hypothetical protein
MSPDQQPHNPYDQAPQRTNGQYEVVPPPVPVNAIGPSGHNPYEFIIAAQPKKRGFSLRLGTDKKSMLIWLGLLLGGVAVVLVVVSIAISVLAPKGSIPGMIAIAQRQQEIIRVADAASRQATTQDVLNLATNADLSLITNQQQVLTFLTTHNTKLKPTVLALDHDAQTDATLANAATTNTYDSAVVQNLSSQLQAYETLLQTTAKQTKNPKTRALLQICFTTADKLLKQAKAVGTTN